MRSMWKGAISFGLVTVPVKLYTATETKDMSFHQVRKSDGSRVRQKRVAEADGEEVAYNDIAKGYQTDTGNMVILTEEDLAQLPLSTSKTIDVTQFVPNEQIDELLLDKPYYIEPEKVGLKPYALLRDAMEKSGRTAVVSVTLRNREAPAVLRVRDRMIVLQTMLWPDEIRVPDFGFLKEDITVSDAEVNMAGQLIEMLAGDFDPGEHVDTYREAVEALVEAKISGNEVTSPASKPEESGNVVDLVAALRASVEAAKKAAAPAAAEDDEVGEKRKKKAG